MSGSHIKQRIAAALKNAPDDGSILLSAFHGAGGPFDNQTPAGLEIVGFGGLPDVVTPEVFDHLRTRFGKSTSTANDAFIPQDKLRFAHQDWKSSVEEILSRMNVQDVFRLELDGLLLSVAGSTGELPERYQWGVAGSLIVTLPSSFEGGVVRKRRGDGEESFPLSAGSNAGHNYVAFLKDGLIDVSAITSGCRVALIYSILHKQEPVPNDPTEDIEALREVLLRWKKARQEEGPSQLVYYLDEPFESIDGQEEVPGIAKSQLSFLQEAGDAEGFHFRVACLTYTVMGRVAEPDDGAREDPSLVQFYEILQTTMELDDFRGVNGQSMPIHGQTSRMMKVEELLEYHPEELFDGETEKPEEAYDLDADDDDDVEMTNGDGYRVEKVFRCNVLLLVPPSW